MLTVLSVSVTVVGMSRPPKYPWSAWFSNADDGEPLLLAAGRDFERGIKTVNLANQIRAKARELKLVVTVRRIDDHWVEIRFPEARTSNGRYPWDTWLDGARRQILFEEITSRPDSFRQHAYAVARDRGLAVQVSVDAPNKVIYLQAVGPYKPRPKPVSHYAPTHATMAPPEPARGPAVPLPTMAPISPTRPVADASPVVVPGAQGTFSGDGREVAGFTQFADFDPAKVTFIEDEESTS